MKQTGFEWVNYCDFSLVSYAPEGHATPHDNLIEMSVSDVFDSTYEVL